MKIREEEQELDKAVDREITRKELRIIETMKDDNCFKYSYRLYVKGTKAEEEGRLLYSVGRDAFDGVPEETYLLDAGKVLHKLGGRKTYNF